MLSINLSGGINTGLLIGHTSAQTYLLNGIVC